MVCWRCGDRREPQQNLPPLGGVIPSPREALPSVHSPHPRPRVHARHRLEDHHLPRPPRPRQPPARPGLCGPAQSTGQSLCPRPRWQPLAGDRPVPALALGAAAGAGLTAGARAQATAGPGPIRRAGAVVMVRRPAL